MENEIHTEAVPTSLVMTLIAVALNQQSYTEDETRLLLRKMNGSRSILDHILHVGAERGPGPSKEPQSRFIDDYLATKNPE